MNMFYLGKKNNVTRNITLAFEKADRLFYHKSLKTKGNQNNSLFS